MARPTNQPDLGRAGDLMAEAFRHPPEPHGSDWSVRPDDTGAVDAIRLCHGDATIARATPWSLNAPSAAAIEAACLHRLTLVAARFADGHGTIGIVSDLTEVRVRRLARMLAAVGLDAHPVILVSRSGRCWASIPGVWAEPRLWTWSGGLSTSGRAPDALPRPLAWTARQQWVVRALLLQPLGKAWWSWPDGGTHRLTARDLADAAGVSISAVSVTVASLVHDRWLHGASRTRLVVAEPRGLAETLLRHATTKPSRVVRVRPAGAGWKDQTAVHEWLRSRAASAGGSTGWALTGWHALAACGLSVATHHDERPIEVLGDSDDLMHRWRLIPTTDGVYLRIREGGGADLTVQPEHDGVLRVVDPLLATTHAADDPESGREQVDFLLDRLGRGYDAVRDGDAS